ncbi:lactate dehydrogenase-like 2-hydroxyacid dehydrogenase [Kribbella amoyensis]|uniref:Lactate dehydrogenase-like 2-hydroxyacid dehydrogenase n=1 Tax=Kribbella amoyensis TaxID=996641 RepID=A0A561B7E9_9ACTN|nr:2-hydroxyacid dehydrogenase [Kribbella amoyensis]TWD74729.1 lactate dehydrogenase-like 2-hydroxyacid dehydrogenase [Kribbella amoyensis]
MSARVLRSGWFKPDLVERLDRDHAAIALPADGSWREFAAEYGQDVEVAVVSGRTGASAELMAALPKLRAVVSHGVGVERTDIAYAAAHGIQVANTPDVLTDCVADTAVAMLLDVMRGLSAADRFVRAGHWPAAGNFRLTRRVSGARVGILGLGRIGLGIARRLEGFGISVSYHNRRPRPDLPYAYASSPLALAKDVDALVVAATGGTDSDQLVDGPVLEALGPRGFLVNIARASIVAEDRMIAMLADGRLGGAALDVFAAEPQVPAELVALDNVVLLPHLASGTQETREAIARLVLANLEAYLATGEVLTPIH